jgi:hypothetical protein
MSISEEELNQIFSYLIGLPTKEAIVMIGHNMSIREVIKEGKHMPCDNFYKDNRLNVEITEKRISRIIGIG